MIPIRDSLRSRRFPIVTVGLIAANLAAFVHEMMLGPAALQPFVVEHAVVPARLLAGVAAGGLGAAQQGLTILSSMFLHGDLLHFLGNMWFLWIFGDNVEDRFGRVGYAVFYVIAGVIAAMSQVLFAPGSEVPMIGASGAVAGVLGAYARFYPGARVLAVVPIFVFLQWTELPALFFLGLWFLLQVVSSVSGAVGVAWWAHIAGFVAGLALSFLAKERAQLEYRPKPKGRGKVIRLRR
ncbi:MAG: rhomboid family intramembrane serine protease [Myxococcota bacterium]